VNTTVGDEQRQPAALHELRQIGQQEGELHHQEHGPACGDHSLGTYFHGGTATGLMHTLATQPDSILVSAETVKDYQLHVGDPLTLRLTDAQTHQPRAVSFHYVGVVSEFPTAPKDSFFVDAAVGDVGVALLGGRPGRGVPELAVVGDPFVELYGFLVVPGVSRTHTVGGGGGRTQRDGHGLHECPVVRICMLAPSAAAIQESCTR